MFHEHTARMGVLAIDSIQFSREFVISDAFIIQTIFQFMDIYEVIFCRNKAFGLIYTLILVWFDLTKV